MGEYTACLANRERESGVRPVLLGILPTLYYHWTCWAVAFEYALPAVKFDTTT